MRIPSGVTDQYIYFVGVDSTDLKTRETGLSSFTVYRSRNGAAASAMSTPTVNETDSTNMPGVYELLLDEDMTIGSGNDSEEMVFHITHAGMAPVTRTVELYRPKITAGNTLGVASDGDVSGNVNGNVVGSVASVTAAVTLPTIPTNWITAAGINAGALDGKGDWNIGKTGYTLTQTFPSNFSSMVINGSGAVDGLVQGFLNNTITEATAGRIAANFDTFFENADAATAQTVDDVGGGSSLTEAGIADAVWNENRTGHTTAGTFGLFLDAQVSTVGGGSLTEAGIADAVWDEAQSGHTTAGTFGLYLDSTVSTAGGGSLTEAGIADAVWDEAQSGHTTAGTFGRYVDSQLATIDTVVDGIKVVTDALPDSGALTSIATAAALTTVDGNVDAILVDTVDIQGRLPAALSGGLMNVNVDALDGSTTSATRLKEAVDCNVTGTVGSSSSTTSIVSSSISPTGTAADQFKGRILTFTEDTTTAALRGQATDITANTAASAPTFTVTALTSAPASGDTFVIT